MDQVWPSATDEIKKHEMAGGETKEFPSLRPTLGRQQTRVSKIISKVQKIFPGLLGKCETKVGGVASRQAVKVKRSNGSLPSSQSWAGSAGPGLERVVLVSITGCFALRVFHLNLETGWKEEPNEKGKNWRQLKSSFIVSTLQPLSSDLEATLGFSGILPLEPSHCSSSSRYPSSQRASHYCPGSS